MDRIHSENGMGQDEHSPSTHKIRSLGVTEIVKYTKDSEGHRGKIILIGLEEERDRTDREKPKQLLLLSFFALSILIFLFSVALRSRLWVPTTTVLLPLSSLSEERGLGGESVFVLS
jgi:hypothetical protein